MSDWLVFPDNTPNEDEPLLIAAITTDNTSVVQFAKYHKCPDCGVKWTLYEPLFDAVITHFMHIPKLPTLHHKLNSLIN